MTILEKVLNGIEDTIAEYLFSPGFKVGPFDLFGILRVFVRHDSTNHMTSLENPDRLACPEQGFESACVSQFANRHGFDLAGHTCNVPHFVAHCNRGLSHLRFAKDGGTRPGLMFARQVSCYPGGKITSRFNTIKSVDILRRQSRNTTLNLYHVILVFRFIGTVKENRDHDWNELRAIPKCEHLKTSNTPLN